MNAMIARLMPRVKQRIRSLAQWLAPAGTWRQRTRFRIVRFVRRLWLPRRPKNVPPLPDFNDPAAVTRYLTHFGLAQVPPVEGRATRGSFVRGAIPLSPPDDLPSSDRIFFWIDFHPFVLSVFPLATTPAERDSFVAWLLTHRGRFRLNAEDILAFARELADDPSCGVEALYRRNADWQRAVPNGLSVSWDDLRAWLARRYAIRATWLTNASRPVEAAHERERPGVNLLAHFCYPSGLQVAAMNSREALIQAGWTVACRDVPNNMLTDVPTRRPWLDLHPHPITLLQLSPMPLGRNAFFMAGLDENPKSYRIGYWYWELEALPATWTAQADWLAELWAPSRFVGEAFRRAMPVPVYEMLPGIAMPPRIEMPRSQFGLPEDRFVFLFAFDMGSSWERKNPEAVVAACRQAFAPNERVSLVIKISRGWQDPLALAALQACAEPGRIVILDRVMSTGDIFGLMNCCDAYVSLHRSEGFGLTLAEAMALGKPTIATGYSGNLDFMNEGNSLLVSYEMCTIRKMSREYARGATWAEPSIEDAARKMRWIVENPVEAKQMGERGRQTVRELLSLEAAGRRMTKRLEEIGNGLISRSEMSPN